MSLFTVQGKIAVTGTLQALGTVNINATTVTITAKSTNAAPIALNIASGLSAAVDGTGTAYILEKGESVEVRVSGASIYVSGTEADIYSAIGA